jgi:hypothetical protein
MAHEPGFIFPDLQDHEAIRARGFVQYIQALVTGLLAARVTVPLEHRRA